MAVKACLNGARSRAEHPAVPVTADELGADARAAREAGAFAVHLHPRDATGAETLAATACAAAVRAIRRTVPSLPVGLSTAAAIEPDPFARARAVQAWTVAPDFVSVNVGELGWAGLVRAALAAGIGVEAGLATEAEADEFAASPFTHRVLRALIEVSGGADEAAAVAARVPAGIPQLWHGDGALTWEVVRAGHTGGHDVRIGLEDTLVMPDGSVASDNAALVRAAVELLE